jgi:RNA polymerase-binding transcription factor DksA
VSSDAPATDFRAILEHERTGLHAKLSEIGYEQGGGVSNDGVLSYDSNFADSSQVAAERGETEALAQSLLDALADVEQALQKLADGTYGVCESCGNQIAPARLEAMPAARLCMSCASQSRR